ncbi:AfsR/SARP family transcriptional regulator [Nonomuraea sp. SYSU D8015]|uniref:AfsR/SARP family transcriptional regulator n=1 Tax=Nonomuraea sp. SYSU D8015 TaxID=2593644 RepID=UPI001660B86E|nr:AfsR/SARP family transcriptional regulator [Nonomuraea sp. SYSU D8015]
MTKTRFSVLGPMEVVHGGRACTPSAPKVRQLLALLLVSANRLVLVDSIVQELWGGNPPKSALTTTQTYIYHLRNLIQREKLIGSGRELLLTKPFGYTILIDQDQLDQDRFDHLVAQADGFLRRGQHEAASNNLREALNLWQGPPLANVTQGPLLRSHVVHLAERRMHALELRIEADIHLGRHRELIGELRSLIAENPLHEWLHAQLITVLSQAGRRGEALTAYQDLREILSRELGLDPSPAVQRLHREVLQGRSALAVPA